MSDDDTCSDIDSTASEKLLPKLATLTSKKTLPRIDRVPSTGLNGVEWWMEAGRAALATRDIGNAIRAYEITVSLDPSNATAMYALAQLFEISGSYQPAIEIYAKLLHQQTSSNRDLNNPSSSAALSFYEFDVLSGLGFCWMCLGSVEQASAFLKLALQCQSVAPSKVPPCILNGRNLCCGIESD